jgi:hypothetical protein
MMGAIISEWVGGIVGIRSAPSVAWFYSAPMAWFCSAVDTSQYFAVHSEIEVPPGGPGLCTGAQLASNARVTMDQARAIALKARPGQITDQELEKEGGGSGLRYSFDIKSGGKIHEVGVDAQSGHVLENKAEGPHPD